MNRPQQLSFSFPEVWKQQYKSLADIHDFGRWITMHGRSVGQTASMIDDNGMQWIYFDLPVNPVASSTITFTTDDVGEWTNNTWVTTDEVINAEFVPTTPEEVTEQNKRRKQPSFPTDDSLDWDIPARYNIFSAKSSDLDNIANNIGYNGTGVIYEDSS